MKKYLTLVFAILLVFIAACGSDNASGDTENTNNDNETEEDSEEEKAKAEVTDSKYYKWLDESVDSETITVYAEVKNTGNIDIKTGNAKMTFLDSNGSVISSTSDGGIIKPGFLKKGEIGFVAAEVYDDISKYDDLDNVEIELSPEPFRDAEIVDLKVKDTKLNIDKWRSDNSKINVTGFLKNESDINLNNDDTTAIMGLYDEDENFLAAEAMYQGQEFSIEANGEASFEVGGGPLPPEVGEEVDHAKVKAIGIENMDDYWW